MSIDLSQWPAISRLLDEALDLPDSERQAWLEQLNEEYGPLKPALREILSQRASVETATFMAPVGRIAEDNPSFADSLGAIGELAAGTIIGAYRLIRELGHGGMGAVWLAERTDGVLKRQVALKLPIVSLQHKTLAERFARERDILAALVHPHIGKLYDAGVTASGQPYLALEYVEGATITEYCDRERLSVRHRLGLFQQVFDAVQYAHSRLVVHRDIKPSNILVTADGQTVLLDFGIAKLIIDGEAKETELTQIGGRALTPDYASPEQIAGEPITTASDVYSLGIVLYELLTGERPYKLARESRGALEEAILAVEPRPPSQVVGDEAKAALRAATAKKLGHLFKGDLDTIVQKALKKHPVERYPTVNAFAEDVLHYLRGEAVLAQRDSTWYRAKKFLGRNRLMAMAGAAVFLALAAGLGAALWQAGVAREQATVAQHETKKAKAVQDFLLDIFRANSDQQQDPIKARQTTARDLLDVGAKRVAENLKDAPEAQDAVLDTLADMYYQLELDDEAAQLRVQRVAALKRAYGPRDPRVADALLSYAADIRETPSRPKVLPILNEAKEILDANNDFSSETRGRLLLAFALFYRYTAPSKMGAYADEAAAFFKQRYPDTWNLPFAIQHAAKARLTLGDYEAAAALFRETLAEVHRREPGNSAWTIFPSVGLADTQAMLGNIGDAEKNYRSALVASLERKGEFHGEALQSEVKLGAFLHATSRREEGRRLLDSALGKIGQGRGNYTLSFVIAVVSGIYGKSLLAEGRIAEAEKFVAVDVDDARQHYPESDPLAKALRTQGALFTALGRYAEAEKLLDEALGTWQRIAGSTADPATSNPYLLEQAHLWLARHDPSAAVAVLGKVTSPKNASHLLLRLGETNATILLAEAYLQQDRTADALRTAQQALEHIQRSPLRAYYQTLEADAALRLGQAQQRSGQQQAAQTNLERALSLREANDDKNSPWLAEAQVALAECLVSLGERTRARTLLASAKAIHATHRELGEYFKRPLRELVERLNRRNS